MGGGRWPGGEHPAINRSWCHPVPTSGSRDAVPLALLHEGLGSISAWGSFPQRLADGTGRSVLAYDRAGYGRSGPRPGPWPAEFMHFEAAELHDLLVEEGLERAILVGHSDGASIALLYPSQSTHDEPEIVGIVSLSAHVMVEALNVAAIVELRRTYRQQLAPRLARHHDDADRVFESWSEVWTSERFGPWTIETDLGAIRCPVLAVQGGADGYGTIVQLERLAAAMGAPVELVELDGVDHWPHREAPTEVVELVASFADRLDPR